MNKRWSLSLRSKTILAILWFAFTLALVGWWWVYSLRQTELKDSAHRMFFWEGSSLVAFVLVGGGMLVFLTYRDERRHERLKFFFSNFTHDIKTSISRLQLQAEILSEQAKSQAANEQNPVFQRLVKDVLTLDLQLENSLWFANLEESSLYFESVSMATVLEQLKNDFEGLEIRTAGDAQVRVDRRALKSVFRNIFQNSIIHGKAKTCSVKITTGDSSIKILVTDDGSGFVGLKDKLGSDVLPEQAGRGNGLGLLLTKRLMQKLKGQARFGVPTPENQGFAVELELPRGRA